MLLQCLQTSASFSSQPGTAMWDLNISRAQCVSPVSSQSPSLLLTPWAVGDLSCLKLSAATTTPFWVFFKYCSAQRHVCWSENTLQITLSWPLCALLKITDVASKAWWDLCMSAEISHFSWLIKLHDERTLSYLLIKIHSTEGHLSCCLWYEEQVTWLCRGEGEAHASSIQQGVEVALSSSRGALPTAGKEGGGESSGKVSVMSLFCEFYPSLNQVDSRFCLCVHILMCILEKVQIASPWGTQNLKICPLEIRSLKK